MDVGERVRRLLGRQKAAGDLRHLAYSETKVLREVDGQPDATERALLVALHGEVCATWRDLHGVRFRLLGLLPLVTLGVFALGSDGGRSLLAAAVTLLIAALGLAVTVGLYIYDLRNSELYDDLISRGRRIEAELGLASGVFRGRVKPQWEGISHGRATQTVYLGVGATWAAGVVLATLNLLAVIAERVG